MTTKHPLAVKRPASERGRTETGWLHSQHTFSFGGYHDEKHTGFRALRVINDDIVEPGKGFGRHGHQDMEIFSYVIEGQLEHRDSMGNGRVIRPGDFQYMSAGTGVQHSEFNPSPDSRVHFLQIWLIPDRPGGEPRYAEKALGKSAAPNALTLVFAGRPREGAVGIRADADIYVGNLETGRSASANVEKGRGVWIHLIDGEIEMLNEALRPGDGISIEGVERIEMKASRDALFLVLVL